MKGHLNADQWAAAVLKENEETTANHLAGCVVCREELNSLASAAEDAPR